MAHASRESVLESGGSSSPASPLPEQITLDRSPKLKGRKRLLHGLQRMSSSQSLLKLGRTPSSGYRGVGKGSISCISLNSPTESYNFPPLGNSYGTESSNGYSTAPTSIPGTPGFEFNAADAPSRVRFVAAATTLSAIPRTPGSVPLPTDIRQCSRPTTSAGIQFNEEEYFSTSPVEAKAKARRPDFDFWREMPTELKMHVLRLLTPKEIVRSSRVSRSWHKMCFDGQLWANLDTADFYRDIPANALVKIINQAGPFARDLNLRGCVQLGDFWRLTKLARACGNLQNVSLEGCKIDRDAVHNLFYSNPRLVHVNISGLATVGNSSMRILADHCPGLEFLNVSWCGRIDTSGLRRVVEKCHQLRDLRASEIRGFDNIDFMHELFKRNSLHRLILMNCDSLTEEALGVLIEGIGNEKDCLTGRALVPSRKLKHLDISRCRAIGDAGVLSLAHNVADLEGLQLSKCREVTDTSMTRLLPTLPRLTHLDLEELDLLSNASLRELAKSPCKNTLQHLSISYCENLGDPGMLPVIKECTSLSSLELDNTRISDLVLIEAASMVRQRFVVPHPMRRAPTAPNATETVSTNASGAGPPASTKPRIGLRMVVYDCQNVTWTGIREVLSRNAEVRRPQQSFKFPSRQSSHHQPQQRGSLAVCNADPLIAVSPDSDATLGSSRNHDFHAQHMPSDQAGRLLAPTPASNITISAPYARPRTPVGPTQPHHIISLKVFYGYQPTVTEHERRVLRSDFAAAARLERKWAEYMVASEEAGAPGGFGPAGFGVVGAFAGLNGLAGRRRRRRVREAMMLHADEEEGGSEGGGGGGGGVGAWFGVGAGGGYIGGNVGIVGPGAAAAGRRRRARSGGNCLVM